MGRERLAQYLQQPAALGEIQRRQTAVRELAQQSGIRERIALLGKYEFEESRWQTFAEWLDSPPAAFPQWLRPVAAITSIVFAHYRLP